MKLKVLYVTSEAQPLVKTGGLADVGSALPEALRKIGADARILMPGYPEARDLLESPSNGPNLGDPLGVGTTRLMSGMMPGSGVPVWLLDCPDLYDRPGGPYQDSEGEDWSDNYLRFALLARMAARLSTEHALESWIPDLVHANDWQSGLVPVYQLMTHRPRPPVVFTIHNLQYQGLFARDVLPAISIGEDWFHLEGVEYFGKVSYLKAALRFSDQILTVSPSYAEEIKHPDGGWGMDGLLRARAGEFRGILNGADYGTWNPETDAHLAAKFTARAPAKGKARCKAGLQRDLGLAQEPKTPLLAVVSRMTEHKGLDLLLALTDRLVATGGQLAVVGSGDPEQENDFRAAAARHPGRIAVRVGYDEALAHRIQAGSDMFVIPSRSEPCGLTQMYAMAYGTVPIGRRTGGLSDTIVDADTPGGTGFLFDAARPEALWHAIERAFALYREAKKWHHLRRRAMGRRFDWTQSAKTHMRLYERLNATQKRPHGSY